MYSVKKKANQTSAAEKLSNKDLIILSKYILILRAGSTEANLVISALECSIVSAKYIVLYMHVLLKQDLKLKVCFLTNRIVVKIKQGLWLNVQIKSDCLITVVYWLLFY